MKLATFNVNGVNGRLSVLLQWLAKAKPDVVCLQELKAPTERFPHAAIREAGYGAIWHGHKSSNGVAILARGSDPVETRRGLPGDPDDTHSARSRRRSRCTAAKRFFRRRLKGLQYVPRVIVTDKLRSYGVGDNAHYGVWMEEHPVFGEGASEQKRAA